MNNNKDASFEVSDFLNGLFIGSLIGAAYVYFFHHPQGKKIFEKYWHQRQQIWQEIKKELAKIENDKKQTRKNPASTHLSYWQKQVESDLRFFNDKKK